MDDRDSAYNNHELAAINGPWVAYPRVEYEITGYIAGEYGAIPVWKLKG